MKKVRTPNFENILRPPNLIYDYNNNYQIQYHILGLNIHKGFILLNISQLQYGQQNERQNL